MVISVRPVPRPLFLLAVALLSAQCSNSGKGGPPAPVGDRELVRIRLVP